MKIMENKVRIDAIQGSFWLIGTNICSIIIRLGSLAVLARLVHPDLFGTFALTKIIYLIPTTVLSSHLAQNIILLKDKKGVLINSIYVSVFYSIIISLILKYFSKEIADYFNDNTLLNIADSRYCLPLILSVNIVLDSYLSKNMKFKRIAIRNFISLIVSVSVTLWLTLNDSGIDALVYGFLVGEVMKLCLLLFNVRFDSLKFNGETVRLLHRNFISINATQLMFQLVNNLDKTLVSKFLNPAALGLYEKGSQVARMPINILANPLQKVGFVTLTKNNEDTSYLEKAMYRAMTLLFKFLFPAAMILYLLAPKIIEILMGNAWLESVPILKIMSFYMFFTFLLKVFTTILATTENYKYIFALNLFGTVLLLVFASFSMKYGLIGMSSLMLIINVLACLLGLIFCVLLLNLSTVGIVKRLWTILYPSFFLTMALIIVESELKVFARQSAYLVLLTSLIIIFGRNVYLEKRLIRKKN